MNDPPNTANTSAANDGPGARQSIRTLAPELDPSRWETLVARIVAEAHPALEARRTQRSLVHFLSAWRRPVMAGAAGLAAAAVATLLLPWGGPPASLEAAFEEVLVPWSVAAWMDGSHVPTAEELVLALEVYSP